MIHCDLRAATKDDLVTARVMIAFNHNTLYNTNPDNNIKEKSVEEVVYEDDEESESSSSSSSSSHHIIIDDDNNKNHNNNNNNNSNNNNKSNNSKDEVEEPAQAVNETYNQGMFDTCDDDEAIAHALAEHDTLDVPEGTRRMRCRKTL